MQKKLGLPIKIAAKSGAKFSVYLAKDFFQKNYSSHEALSLLKKARKSYLRYGNVAPLDRYDEKSLIYLVRTVYKTKTGKQTLPVEEWLSVRFIPGRGWPALTEDFAHCLAEDKPLKHLFQKKLFPETKNFSRHVATISRLCKISPRIIGSGRLSPQLPKKNKYTLISFCLANQAFLEHEYSRENFLYLTGLFREEVLKKSLSINFNGSYLPRFEAGHRVLKTGRASRVKIKRYPFIYGYPGYFLDHKDIAKLLKKLLNQGLITPETLNYYTKKTDPDALAKTHHGHLGRMLNERGKLKFSSLHSHKLRKMVNEQVKDGPRLKITGFHKWAATIQKTLALF